MAGSTDPMTLARQHVERALVARASDDTEFRALLVREPRAALKQLLGVDPIPGFRIRVIEEVPGEVTLVLPRDIAADELPDELLDLASGGTTFQDLGCKDPRAGWAKPITKIVRTD